MYELMVAGRTDSADKLFELTEKLLKGANASSVVNSKMGKKTLAYPIKKQTEAEYFVFNFEAPAESIFAIADGLRLEQEMVLRYMVTKSNVKSPAAAETSAGKQMSKVSKVTEEPKELEETKVETKVKASVKVASKVKTTVKSKSTKVKTPTKSKGKKD